MKGKKFCTWYDGTTKKFFMLDPDLITQIQVADFDHFTDLAFTPEAYIKVTYCDYKYLTNNAPKLKQIIVAIFQLSLNIYE